jgi:hypothetical protein
MRLDAASSILLLPSTSPVKLNAERRHSEHRLTMQPAEALAEPGVCRHYCDRRGEATVAGLDIARRLTPDALRPSLLPSLEREAFCRMVQTRGG